VQLECRVTEIKELGQQGGAGNLVICEIIKIHISEKFLDENKNIDTRKIDLVARMGDNWYCRAHGDALFEVKKPITTIGIGIDQIPAYIRNSNVLTGNNLGLLASVEKMPEASEALEFKKTLKTFGSINEKHQYARQLLENNQLTEAWYVLLE
jgi:hypothetical protein